MKTSHPTDDMNEPISQDEQVSQSGDSTERTTLVEQLRAEAESNLEGWKRANADLENAKRRHDEMLAVLIERRQAELFRSVLPIIDDLRRLDQHLPAASREGWTPDQVTQFINGTKSILKKGEGVLEKMGLTRLDLKGRSFDPGQAEAITEIPSDEPAGTIVDIVEEGYLSGEYLVRPARVVVSKGPPDAPLGSPTAPPPPSS